MIVPPTPVADSMNGFLAQGVLHRVRVTSTFRGPKQALTLLFHGRVDQLVWDPERFEWHSTHSVSKRIPFMEYSLQLRRELLKKNLVV